MKRHAVGASMVLAAALTLAMWPQLAAAATLDGASLSALWGLPFAGVLLSIAVFPLVAPAFWHHHFGKIAAAWALLFLAPFALTFGSGVAFGTLVHALLEEYIPFIVLLTALYTVAGGICVRGNLHGTPRLNTAILALGTLLASIMGTTGAAMLLIRPLLRANDNRKHVVHVVVFFIFLVANAGGSLSPLGDPPLFLGFLQGVSFFWTTTHLALPMLFVCVVLLTAFYALDSYYFHRREEERSRFLDPTPDSPPLGIDGKINFVLLVAVIALVLMSGLWKSEVVFDVFGTHVALQNAVRDVALIGVTLLSLALTPRAARTGNDFNWAPIEEVAKLFAGIFVTIAPVITILRAGEAGAFAGIVHLVNPAGQRAGAAPNAQPQRGGEPQARPGTPPQMANLHEQPGEAARPSNGVPRPPQANSANPNAYAQQHGAPGLAGQQPGAEARREPAWTQPHAPMAQQAQQHGAPQEQARQPEGRPEPQQQAQRQPEAQPPRAPEVHAQPQQQPREEYRPQPQQAQQPRPEPRPQQVQQPRPEPRPQQVQQPRPEPHPQHEEQHSSGANRDEHHKG